MSRLRDFARSLRPGNDAQLAAELRAQRSRRHNRAATQADRDGQAWDAQDRADEKARRGRYAR
jgi:hypothetical protein